MAPLRRSLRSSLALIAPLLLLLAGCAPRAQTTPRFGARLITHTDLQRFMSVEDAVQVLRSGWLVRRSPVRLTPFTAAGETASPVWVYRDGTRIGSPEVLRYISTSEVWLVEYFDGRSASLRWGMNHENGVIHVLSR